MRSWDSHLVRSIKRVNFNAFSQVYCSVQQKVLVTTPSPFLRHMCTPSTCDCTTTSKFLLTPLQCPIHMPPCYQWLKGIRGRIICLLKQLQQHQHCDSACCLCWCQCCTAATLFSPLLNAQPSCCLSASPSDETSLGFLTTPMPDHLHKQMVESNTHLHI